MQDLPPLVGANALLPAVIAIAAQRTGVRRVIHLSSAAVQGPRLVLDDSEETNPVQRLLLLQGTRRRSAARPAGLLPRRAPRLRTRTVHPSRNQRAGPSRRTTELFAKMASSPFASVAGAGTGKSPGLQRARPRRIVVMLGTFPGELPTIVLQPWEGATVASASVDAGRRHPHRLPEWLCRAAVKAGYTISELMNDKFAGSVRKVEVMWFGQGIDDSWARDNNLLPTPRVREVLRNAHTALGKKKDRRFEKN